jgi:hypothetical protein
MSSTSKDPTTETMRTLADLRIHPFANAFTIDIMTAATAATLSRRLSDLPLVSEVLSIKR